MLQTPTRAMHEFFKVIINWPMCLGFVERTEWQDI